MGNKFNLLILFLIFASVSSWAREVIDTLESSKKDRVIITYDITQTDRQATIKFLDVKKKLGRAFKDNYKKLDEIAILFFDRTGNYDDKTEFSGINTDAFMIPKDIKYKVSKDGYYLLNDNPTITMELKSGDNIKVSIPIFIAHYEGKKRYKVFSRCENLIIELSKKKNSNVQDRTAQQQTTKIITSEEEVEGEFTDIDEAKILINKVQDLLADAKEYPFSEELKQAISSLRDRSYRITDDKASSIISEVLRACKIKENELKSDADAAAEAAEREAERLAKQAEEQARARQDSINEAARIKAEEDKKQNLWLIIGGVILAILGFIGNKAFNIYNNKKNQENFARIQDGMVKRAENEAKRRARNMAQNQINQVKREARKKTQSAINDRINTIGKRGKGNQSISI